MRLLLDTHVALWCVSEPSALSSAAREAIVGADEVRLSVVSPWEMVIKAALGKLALQRSVEDICREVEREFGAASLAVTIAHVLEVVVSLRTTGTRSTGSSSRRRGSSA